MSIESKSSSRKTSKRVFYGHADSLDGPRATFPVEQLPDYDRNVDRLLKSPGERSWGQVREPGLRKPF